MRANVGWKRLLWEFPKTLFLFERIRGTREQGAPNELYRCTFGGHNLTEMENGERNGLFLVAPLLPVILA